MAIKILDFCWDSVESIFHWIANLNWIPATACVAIFLFVLREVLEHNRKKAVKEREISALKLILARECELNWYVCGSIEDICKVFEPYESNKQTCPYIFKIVDLPTTQTRYEITSKDKFEAEEVTGAEGGVVPEVHTESISKHLFDIAKADREFYDKAQKVYDSVFELNHLKNSILDMPSIKKIFGNTEMMVGFSGYALGSIAEIKINLKALHLFCTGKEEIVARLR